MITLLKKEWREHRIVIALLYLVGLFMLISEWQQAKNAVTPLQAWSQLVIRFGTLAAIFITNRLVVREYAASTQLFLETLPISRGRVFFVKWLAGWCALLVFMGTALACILWGARGQVDLDARFIGLLCARAFAYLLLVYSVAFAIALTLRLRLYLWIMLLFTVAVFDTLLQMPSEDWPPFHLVKASMALERSQVPWRELGITVATALATLSIALGLALSAQGALVVALARRPSARTRTVLALLFGVMVLIATVLEKRRDPPPLEMQMAVASASLPRVEIGWLHQVGSMPAPEAAARISADLARMQAWLGMARLARTSLMLHSWGEAGDYTEVRGSPHHVVIRAALGHPDLPVRDLEATLRATHVLDQAPLYRWREDRQWLLTGFTLWWGAQEDAAFQTLLERRARAAADRLQADAANAVDYAPSLRASASTDEALGSCLSDALSWRAVRILADDLGPERFRALMRAALAVPLADDLDGIASVRATDALLEAAGHSMNRVGATLGRVLPPRALAPLPALQVEARPLAGDMVELHYRASHLPAGADVALHYRPLRAAESIVSGAGTRWAALQASGVIPAVFTSGSRVLVFGQVRDRSLGCAYRFGAIRKELP